MVSYDAQSCEQTAGRGRKELQKRSPGCSISEAILGAIVTLYHSRGTAERLSTAVTQELRVMQILIYAGADLEARDKVRYSRDDASPASDLLILLLVHFSFVVRAGSMCQLNE